MTGWSHSAVTTALTAALAVTILGVGSRLLPLPVVLKLVEEDSCNHGGLKGVKGGDFQLHQGLSQ